MTASDLEAWTIALGEAEGAEYNYEDREWLHPEETLPDGE